MEKHSYKTGRILILGGGFGGVRAALDLSRRLKDSGHILLVDKNQCHVFVPSLYEVASAFGLPRDPFSVVLKKTIAIPYEEVFRGTHVQYMQGEVQNVNLDRQIVTTKGGMELDYDYLVLALGGQTADFGIPGVADYTYKFQTIEDALTIKQKLEAMHRQAPINKQNTPFKILICGAGFSGIELAAELAATCRKMCRKFKVSRKTSQIYLFEASGMILSHISDNERAMIRRRLTDLGIVIMENSAIEDVHGEEVRLKNGQTMRGDMIIWTAGIKANNILTSIDNLQLTARGKIIVNEHLHLLNYKNVFAVGDNTEFIDRKTQKPVPALAYVAIDQAAVAALNICSSIKGNKLTAYKPAYNTWVAPVGGKYAVAHLHVLGQGITIRGYFGWFIRWLIDLRYFATILPFTKVLRLFREQVRVFTKND